MQEIEMFLMSGKKVFMDTSSLLYRSVEKFWMKAVPLIENYRNPIIVPFKCYEEIEKHSNQNKKPDLKVMARKQLKNLCALDTKKDIVVRGDRGENFADSVFHTVFEKFRITYELVLITQDNNLAKEILKKNESKSSIGKKIVVRRLNDDGELVRFNWDKDMRTGSDAKEKGVLDAFKLCTSVIEYPNDVISVSNVPGMGSTVYDGCRQRYVLRKELGRGGEGIIYDVGNKSVAKIYHEGKHNTYRRKKLELMVSRKIKYEGICYPQEILYNSGGEFVGYLMPISKGKNLQHTVFGKPFIVKNFPYWEKVHLVKLCLTILDKIDYLHKYNILLGDINPLNILVSSPTEVYFVDTDSYQVEGFPCPVGTINFTAPEIQNRNFNTFMRSKQNENFAIAVLIFMILHCGKHPYSQLGGESMIENIQKMEFPYPFGEKSNKKAPAGAYRYMWSHLDLGLKKLFYEVFQKGEPLSSPECRPTVRKWISALSRYKSELENGNVESFDAMSMDLFPTRFKRANKEQIFIKCRKCGREFDAAFSKGRDVCRDCYNQEREKIVYDVKCLDCGAPIRLNKGKCEFYEKKGFELPVRCVNCKKVHRQEIESRKREREYKNQVYTYCTCKDCGCSFEITNGEYDFYRNKGFKLPSRCPSCRQNKNSKHESSGNLSNGSGDNFTGSSSWLGKFFSW